MKKNIAFIILLAIPCLKTFSQSTGNIVLIEEFTETGCGACSEYDSAFQAITNANMEKVAVINYHCFYSLDTFYMYNRSCDKRYSFYSITDGYPTTMVNGKKPGGTSAHMAYVKEPLIKTEYDKPLQFKIEINATPNGKSNLHTTSIKVKATCLKDNPSMDIRIFVTATENNINYIERYHAKTPNGLDKFNHIIRAFLPDTAGTTIGAQTNGKVNQVKVTFTNDDKEINYKEVRIIAFVQDMITKEILGTAITNKDPFTK